MRDLANCVVYVQEMTDATVVPVVSPAQVEAAVSNAAIASFYAANTSYNVGDRVVLQSTNGRYYKCLVSGNSADSANAPSWPNGQQAYPNQTVYDNTVVWTDDGTTFPELYDLNAAIQTVLQIKIAQTVRDISVSDGKEKAELQQRHQQLKQLRAMFPSMWVP